MGIIIDVVVALVALIIILVSTKQGCAITFYKFMKRIGCLVAAVVLTMVLVSVLAEFSFVQSFSDTVSGWLEPLFAKVSGASTVVSSQSELESVLSSGALAILSSTSESLWASMESMGLYTVAGVYSAKIFSIVLNAITFFVLFVVLLYFFKGLNALLSILNKVSFFALCDRILGFLFGVLLAYIVLVLILSAVELVLATFLTGYIDAVMALIGQSTLLTQLHNNNIIGALIASLAGLSLPVLS